MIIRDLHDIIHRYGNKSGWRLKRGKEIRRILFPVLAAALISPLVALAIFRITAKLPARVRERQLLRAATSQIVDLSDDVDPERDHIRGRPDAPVTLLEYGDFECPYCGTAQPTIEELLRRFPEELRFVFRHLPLNDVHTNAQIAAEAAEAAAAQGEFWDMYDLLLAHQDALSPRDLVLDLREEEIIHPTSRFQVYALFPQCNISMHVLWGLKQQNTVFAVGKSILDRSSKTRVGALMLEYGGGGHDAAGTCQVENERASAAQAELVARINADG